MNKATILIDVELPDPQPIAPVLRELMGALKVILVGWYRVPEQTSPAQAKDQFEDEVRRVLDRIGETFRSGGTEVQTHLVFTGNELDTVERISAEEDCDAVLIPKPVDHLERILVPLRGVHNADRIARFTADLVQDGTTDITLLHVLEEDEREDAVKEDILGKVSAMMTRAGINAGLIRMRLKTADDPGKSIVTFARDYDLVVIGETEPSIRDVLFGTVSEQIAHEANLPVMVVRKPQGE